MAFLADIKEEICRAIPKSACCRRSLLLGMLAARAAADENGEIVLKLTDPNATELALHLIGEQFGRQAEKLPQKHGGRVHVIGFRSAAASKFIAELATKFFNRPLPKQCGGCALSFLRGVFLAAGHITDPTKAYHLEFSLGERAEAFAAFLEREFGLCAGIAKRRNEVLLYWKDSEILEEIMTMLGINDAAFHFMNAKIEKQFRNEANRRTNCEASNISRSVNAASKTVAVLEKMRDNNRLSSLTDDLAEVANLRLAYPEASLTQLAGMMTPPLTKSGLNHRLHKILEFAAEANGEE